MPLLASKESKNDLHRITLPEHLVKPSGFGLTLSDLDYTL